MRSEWHRLFGLRLMYLRHRAQLSQKGLAEKVELSPSHLSMIEKGERRLFADDLLKISNELGVSVDDIFDDELRTKLYEH